MHSVMPMSLLHVHGEWGFQDEIGLSSREEHQVLFSPDATLPAIIITSFIFPLSSDVGTAVFCAERNYDYYFGYSTGIMA